MTGSIPGIAASTSETWLLGSPPKAVEAPENSFEFEVTWAWTSIPITTSQSPVEPLINLWGVVGAFMGARCSGSTISGVAWALRNGLRQSSRRSRRLGPRLGQRLAGVIAGGPFGAPRSRIDAGGAPIIKSCVYFGGVNVSSCGDGGDCRHSCVVCDTVP